MRLSLHCKLSLAQHVLSVASLGTRDIVAIGEIFPCIGVPSAPDLWGPLPRPRDTQHRSSNLVWRSLSSFFPAPAVPPSPRARAQRSPAAPTPPAPHVP